LPTGYGDDHEDDGWFCCCCCGSTASSKKGHDSDTLKFEVKSSMLLPWSCSLVALVDICGCGCGCASCHIPQHISCGIIVLHLAFSVTVLAAYPPPFLFSYSLHCLAVHCKFKRLRQRTCQEITLNSRMLARFYVWLINYFFACPPLTHTQRARIWKVKFQSRTSGSGSNNARLEVPIKMGSLVVGQSVRWGPAPSRKPLQNPFETPHWPPIA